MRAVIYTRCSTDEQATNGNTLEMQAERCKALVISKGWVLVETIRDAGFSAKNLDRPGIQQLLSMVQGKPRRVDAIVVLKLDRLTRSVMDLGNLLALLEKNKVALAGPEVVFDTSTSAGKLIANLLTSVSQWEREQIGERTRAVLQHRRTLGLAHAPREPFGYQRVGHGKDARFVPVPHELAIVATMRSLRANGATFREIVTRLNTKAIPTKRGGVWDPGTVREILLRS